MVRLDGTRLPRRMGWIREDLVDLVVERLDPGSVAFELKSCADGLIKFNLVFLLVASRSALSIVRSLGWLSLC